MANALNLLDDVILLRDFYSRWSPGGLLFVPFAAIALWPSPICGTSGGRSEWRADTRIMGCWETASVASTVEEQWTAPRGLPWRLNDGPPW